MSNSNSNPDRQKDSPNRSYSKRHQNRPHGRGSKRGTGKINQNTGNENDNWNMQHMSGTAGSDSNVTPTSTQAWDTAGTIDWGQGWQQNRSMRRHNNDKRNNIRNYKNEQKKIENSKDYFSDWESYDNDRRDSASDDMEQEHMKRDAGHKAFKTDGYETDDNEDEDVVVVHKPITDTVNRDNGQQPGSSSEPLQSTSNNQDTKDEESSTTLSLNTTTDQMQGYNPIPNVDAGVPRRTQSLPPVHHDDSKFYIPISML